MKNEVTINLDIQILIPVGGVLRQATKEGQEPLQKSALTRYIY